MNLPGERASATEVVLIAAVADDGAIGAGNDLPWRLPADLQRFKRLTLGAPLVMGRRTFESIGRPLPGRANIVITRRRGERGTYASGDGTSLHTVDSPAAGLLLGAEIAVDNPARPHPPAEIYVGGGGEVYAATIAVADRLEITHVHTTVADGDAWFPPIDPDEWEAVVSVPGPADAEHLFEWVTYRRRS